MSIELAESPGSELAPVADAVSSALAEISAKHTSITERMARARELHEQYKGVAFNVTTTKGMEEARTARKALRDEARYPMQDLKKEGSKLLGVMQRQFNDHVDGLIAQVVEFERPIHEQITAEEDRKETERLERERLEAQRKQSHQDAIAAIQSLVSTAAGMDSAALAERIAAVQAIAVDESWEEYEGQAEQAKDEVLRQLTGMRLAVLADEDERRDLEAQRQRQREWDAQQVARQADLDRREQDLQRREREQREEQEQIQRARLERAQAVQGRIDAIATAGAPLQERSIGDLCGILVSLRSLTLTPDLLDDRVSEAAAAAKAREAEVEQALEAAEALKRERDRQEEAERREARDKAITERIAGLRAIGDSHTKDDAPDVVAAAIGLARDLLPTITEEDYDNRVDEARDTLVDSIASLAATMQAATERARLDEEEAQRQRERDLLEADQRAMSQRMLKASPRLYLRLLDMVIAYQHEASAQSPALLAAKAIILEINPQETFE